MAHAQSRKGDFWEELVSTANRIDGTGLFLGSSMLCWTVKTVRGGGVRSDRLMRKIKD